MPVKRSHRGPRWTAEALAGLSEAVKTPKAGRKQGKAALGGAAIPRGSQKRQPSATGDLLRQLAALKLPAPTLEYRFDPVRRWRFDVAWPARLAAMEIDGGTWSGGRHVRGAGYEKDCEKLNAAALAGWRVFRVTPAMVRSGEAVKLIERVLW